MAPTLAMMCPLVQLLAMLVGRVTTVQVLWQVQTPSQHPVPRAPTLLRPLPTNCQIVQLVLPVWFVPTMVKGRLKLDWCANLVTPVLPQAPRLELILALPASIQTPHLS